MVEVIGVTLKEKVVYIIFYQIIMLLKNVTVIVETERGLQFGKVVTDIIKYDESKLKIH